MRLIKFFFIIILLTFSVIYVFAQESNEQQKQIQGTELVNKTYIITDTTTRKTSIPGFSSEQTTVITQLKKEKLNCDINNFLDIEDDSIFNSKFKKFDLSLMHSRNQLYYQLISNIHELDSLLVGIGKMTLSQLVNINKDIEVARKKIEVINSFATDEKKKVTDFLSEKQKQYYRSKVDIFNELHHQFYPNE